MRIIRWMTVAVLAGTLAARAGDTGTDPAHKYAWGENVGWLNAHSSHHSLTIHYSEGTGGWLTGHVWAENIGWIVMGSPGGGPYRNTTADNWGVNLVADGKLSGYAWGGNVGWINFEQTHGKPTINPANGDFWGYAWGENIGWVSFRGVSPDYGVRTLAFDTQPKGTPNWWLTNHGVHEEYDAGDNVPAWRKFVMDTDPNVAGDYLRIVSITNENGEAEVLFYPASTRRYYTLTATDDLTDAAAWGDVVGQVSIPGTGAGQTLRDAEPGTRAFYRIRVEINP